MANVDSLIIASLFVAGALEGNVYVKVALYVGALALLLVKAV